MKYVLIIGDGMADNPVPELGGITPLQKANIPAIDALASAGRLGHCRTVPLGLPAGSDTAILSIMGCPTRECYSGRAPLEAAAGGIILEAGSAAFRCNNIALELADTLEQMTILSHSGGNIEGAESHELIEYLFNHPDFKPYADKAGMSVAAAYSYRHLAFRKNADIAGIVLAPPHDHLGETAEANLPTGCADAEVLKELMRRAVPILDAHPINVARKKEGLLSANAIWFWAEGTAAALPNFAEQYGKTGAVISAVPLCHGIARLVGLDVIEVEGATGELDTNLEGKVDAAVQALETRDFVTIHVEAPDECTHCHDLEGKILAIEYLSDRVTAPLVEKLNATGEDYRILIISDHKTLSENGAHDGDPVPFILYDSREDRKNGMGYCEENGEKGEFIEHGESLMGELFSK